MKPQETAPFLTAIAPAALVVPPVAIVGILIGVGLLWLLSAEDGPKEKPATTETPSPAPLIGHSAETSASPVSRSTAIAKKVTREDLAEALAYGANRLTRKQAVTALESLGFRKTSAYKALSPEGKFAGFIEFTPDGMIKWKG